MWQWLRTKAVQARFDRYPDCYALTRARLLVELERAIANSRQTSSLSMVVAHFPATFEGIQDHLDQQQIAYRVMSERKSAGQIAQLAAQQPGQVWLTLSGMLTESDSMPPIEAKCSFAMIAVERHPDWNCDQRLEKFGRHLPGPTRLGYFLSVSDPAVRLAIPEQMLVLLQQLGFNEQELITSSMVSKRLNIVLKRLKPKKHSSWIDSDSVEEWISANL